MGDRSKYPFVRMLIPFALGIWCCACLPGLPLSSMMLVSIALALFGLSVVTSSVLKRQRMGWLFGVVMACYLFLGGYALTRVHEAETRKDYFRNHETGANYYVARVCDCPTERESSIRTVLQLEHQFGGSSSSRAVTGKVMAYFPKSDSAFALRYGDLVAFPAPIREVSGPKNPGEFDYRDYLLRRGITGQVYLRDDDWLDLQVNNANPIYAFSYRVREILLASLRQNGLSDNEFGVAATILLGYDEKLADEVRKNYVAAGSMHILCVSGMHVGIIFLLASFLLGFLNRNRWQKTLKQTLLLVLVWFYAFIAGLSPSVLRASLMISFVIIGEMIHRKGFVLNSIAASAFILLCLNPNNLFEIGFLLSYSAVVGIVVLQKPIYNMLYFNNMLLDKAWEITTVALAAQMATIPYTLFYFNQFTSYFWLSNLFMTPIAFVVVITGMVLLMVAWIPYLNIFVGRLVWGAVFVMNWIVAKIESLPFSIIKGVYVSDLEFAFLLLAFVLLLLAVSMQKRRLLVAMLSSLLIVMVSVTVRLYSADSQHRMTFFSLRKHTAVDFVNGSEHIMLADSSLKADESTIDYSLKCAWARQHLSTHPQMVGFEDDFENDYLSKKSNLVSFEGKLLAVWDDVAFSDSLAYRIPVDYLLVRGRQKPDVQSVVNSYDAKILIVDGSVPRYLAEKWVAQADEKRLPVYDLSAGALVVDLGE